MSEVYKINKPVKSIFRQRVIENLYYLRGWGFFNNDEKDKFITSRDGIVVSDKIIGEYDIDVPLLEEGDKFYLNDIKEAIVVEKRIRSSDGSIVYFVEDKHVDTDNSKKTMEECNQKIAYIQAQKKEFETYKQKYKYKHRFFNFKKSEQENNQVK